MRIGDGDIFPETDRCRYVEERFVPGAVLYLWCEFTEPAKEKYVVIACAEPLLLFVVNSCMSFLTENRPYLRKCQIGVNACDYKFLQHNSFIDCSEVIASVELDELTDQLVDQTSRIKGILERSTIEQIIDAVRNAETISNAHKAAIEQALSCLGSPGSGEA